MAHTCCAGLCVCVCCSLYPVSGSYSLCLIMGLLLFLSHITCQWFSCLVSVWTCDHSLSFCDSFCWFHLAVSLFMYICGPFSLVLIFCTLIHLFLFSKCICDLFLMLCIHGSFTFSHTVTELFSASLYPSPSFVCGLQDRKVSMAMEWEGELKRLATERSNSPRWIKRKCSVKWPLSLRSVSLMQRRPHQEHWMQ